VATLTGCCCGTLWLLQAYQGAVEVLAAVADRLRASTSRFFFGNTPSSLDALLFGHLAFYRHSPVAAPVLREKVNQQQPT
jgi:metaxin